MAQVLSRPNLLAALKRAEKNKGSPGIDGMKVKQKASGKAPEVMTQRVRWLTRRSRGRSLAQAVERLREYLVGWKTYFHLADTPRLFQRFDQWLRHRLRALQPRHWRRGPTIYRELRARVTPHESARIVAVNSRR